MNSYKTKVCTTITSSSIVLDKFVYNDKMSADDIDRVEHPSTKKSLPVLKQIQYNGSDHKTRTYEFIELITCGGNGCIIKYSNIEDKNDSVALKVTTDIDEVQMIRTLDSCLNCTVDFYSCNVVQARYFGKWGPYHFILLPLMDGSLDRADLDKWTYKLQVQFISFITSELSCLYRKNLLYVDIKLANLLYKCVKNDVLEIVLGDIGSITQLGNPGLATYPYCMRLGHNTSDIDVVWGICVMWCMLYDNDSKKINKMWYHENINKLQPMGDDSDDSDESNESNFQKRFEEFRKKMLAQVNATGRIIDEVNKTLKTNEKGTDQEFNKIKKFMLGYMEDMIKNTSNVSLLQFTNDLFELMKDLYNIDTPNQEAINIFFTINKAKADQRLDELTWILVKENKYKYLPYAFKKGATQKQEYIDYAVKKGLFNTAVNLINSYKKDNLYKICQHPHYRSYIEDVRVCAKYLESEERKREEPASGRGAGGAEGAAEGKRRKREETASASRRGAGGAEGSAEGKREGDDARRKKIRTAAASDSGDDKEGWCTIN